MRFPSKLLIAGEFTVLSGGDALAIPFDQFAGVWVRLDHTDTSLFPFAEYLQKLDFIDGIRLEQDIHNGWQFQSTIPTGYGLGSSGALSAAIYYYYAINPAEDHQSIQYQLARIEHFFHGKSSGFDPLISYKNQAFAIINQRLCPVHTTTTFKPNDQLPLYLLDSGMSRGHINSIQWFYKEMDNPAFHQKIQSMNVCNKALIDAWYHGHTHLLPDLFQLISALQFEIFQPLITPSIRSWWSNGLESGKYYIKLCGKGGGGYYLLWINDPESGPFKELIRVPVFLPALSA